MADGKRDRKRARLQPVSPAEVARTLLARARELPTRPADNPKIYPATAETLDAVDLAGPALDLRATSGVRPTRRADAPASADLETPPPVLPPTPPHGLELTGKRYVRVGVLGQGGMGRVDEVMDRVLGRPVAQKALLHGAGEERATMLVAEAQTCAQLEHPSIVPVYDLGALDDGQPFYTMRVVRGRTLRDVLEDNHQPNKPHTPLAQILGIFRQVCLAVDYAHSKGVVHRDLKPDNVIVGEFGEVYVVDWGIAHLIEGSAVRRSSIGPVIAGTPAYMAPEQILGGAVDQRADVFALGVMLYEILAGERPFTDESLRGVHFRRERSVDVPPSGRAAQTTHRPAGSAPTAFFDVLVLSALEPDRSHRPDRARVLASAVDEFLDAERARAERAREAEAHVAASEQALADHESNAAEATQLEAEAEKLLGEIPSWENAQTKQPAWALIAKARRLRADAARALARTETELARAVGRVADHAAARKGLAALYYRQFLAAEEDGDDEQMAQLLDLARAYDDGAHALELANQGELLVKSTPSGARVTLQRYESSGPLLTLGPAHTLGETPTASHILACGSYLVTLTLATRAVRYPILVRRAQTHEIRARIPDQTEIPNGMMFVPGGPFLALAPRAQKLVALSIGDFAIARFPITFAEYCEFLDGIGPERAAKRLPQPTDGDPTLVRASERWQLCARMLEGDGRARVDEARELELPATLLRWHDAIAYIRWRSQRDGVDYRLPNDLEWEKAMRGADGRAFPMGTKLDPSFAKLRESRPESSQPEPVGAFPLDESPYGVRDLAGGVGDWTSTFVDGNPPPSVDEEDTPAAQERQVYWRGGTWAHTSVGTMRYAQSARHASGWIGFRLALSLDSNGSSELITSPMKRG